MTTERELPETSRIFSYGEYKLRGYKGITFEYYLRPLREVAADLSEEVLAISAKDAAEEVVSNMSRGGGIIIATLVDTGEAVGYSTQRILQPFIGTNRPRVMYVSTRAVKPEHQRGGLGTALLQYANTVHDAPDIIGGRTQNPAVVRSYYQSGLFKMIYPFDKTYEESLLMQEVLRYIVAQTRHKYPVDERTGLVQAVYKDGKSSAYDNEQASPEVQEIYARMLRFGLVLDNGDALHVTGIVNKGEQSFAE